MEKPRDMDLTRAAQDVKATIAMARSFLKMQKPEEAKEKAKQADEALKRLVKLQADLEKSSPNHPRLASNIKSIQEAEADYKNYCTSTVTPAQYKGRAYTPLR